MAMENFLDSFISNQSQENALVIIFNYFYALVIILIQLVKRYAAWNGYLWNVANSIIKHAPHSNYNNNIYNNNNIDHVIVYIKIKYSVETEDRLRKQCMKKPEEFFKNDKS